MPALSQKTISIFLLATFYSVWNECFWLRGKKQFKALDLSFHKDSRIFASTSEKCAMFRGGVVATETEIKFDRVAQGEWAALSGPGLSANLGEL